MRDQMTLDGIRDELESLTNPERASFLRKFFKTGPGQYGEGDLFRGIPVPALRRLAAGGRGIGLDEAEELLHSPFHEDRLVALLIFVERFRRGDDATRRQIYDRYLFNARYVNGWDLVDVSAEHIVGAWLYGRGIDPLEHLARSSVMWERRIAIMATFHFIRKGVFDPTMTIAAMLAADPEDLIQKAVGWMLREVGKRDPERAEAFLRPRCRTLPRTMLRYAIEKFTPEKRLAYLKGVVREEMT